MFEKRALMFLYAISPVHMGAGQAIGVVDNPIQRERHTNHPIFAGSGLKGALRDVFEASMDRQENVNANTEGQEQKQESLTSRIFGPPANTPDNSGSVGSPDHAGSVAFGDAQVVLFPVRSLRQSFAYVTSPTALARLKRAAELCELKVDWSVPYAREDCWCKVPSADSKLLLSPPGEGSEKRVVLETFEFHAEPDEALGKVAKWLSDHALPDESQKGFGYFQEKMLSDLVLVSDTRFDYFIENATIVEPHVRIADESGTADDGGLFYTENVPPESLFMSVVMASRERVKKGHSRNNQLKSDQVIGLVSRALDGKTVQIGGDATTGRGLVVVRFVIAS